jgi:hypothetical protein
MFYKLICLNRNGVALSAQEVAESPKYSGNLVIEDWHQGGRFGRFIRQARLLDMAIPTTPRDIIPPLFDPQLVRMTDNQMTLQGYQIHADSKTGAALQFLQCWVVRSMTISDDGSLLEKRIC